MREASVFGANAEGTDGFSSAVTTVVTTPSCMATHQSWRMRIFSGRLLARIRCREIGCVVDLVATTASHVAPWQLNIYLVAHAPCTADTVHRLKLGKRHLAVGGVLKT